MKKLVVDGADITAIIPRYSNRLIDEASFDSLLSRKRITNDQLCNGIGITKKTLWRFRRRHRVLPVVSGWRMTSLLHARIGDFTVQHSAAPSQALINTILWDTRALPRPEIDDLVERLTERLLAKQSP